MHACMHAYVYALPVSNACRKISLGVVKRLIVSVFKSCQMPLFLCCVDEFFVGVLRGEVQGGRPFDSADRTSRHIGEYTPKDSRGFGHSLALKLQQPSIAVSPNKMMQRQHPTRCLPNRSPAAIRRNKSTVPSSTSRQKSRTLHEEHWQPAGQRMSASDSVGVAGGSTQHRTRRCTA